MFKTKLKTKLIVAVMLIMGVTAFMSCEKEKVITYPNQNVEQNKISQSKNDKEIVLQNNVVDSLFIDMNKFISLLQEIDKNKIKDCETGKITSEELYESMPDNIKYEYDNVYYSFQRKLKIIEKKYGLKNINWERSFYEGDMAILNKSMDVNISYCKAKDCATSYALSSAGNFAVYVATVTGCGVLAEVPVLAAACIYGATEQYVNNQNQTVNQYYDCLKHQNN